MWVVFTVVSVTVVAPFGSVMNIAWWSLWSPSPVSPRDKDAVPPVAICPIPVRWDRDPRFAEAKFFIVASEDVGCTVP